MQESTVKTERRRQDRTQAVLPVRVRGTDASGATFEALAHTLVYDATHSILLADLDIPATIAANDQRGIEFKLPKQ